MEQIITGYDYLLLPFYLVMFYLIANEKAKKYTGTPLKKFFLLAFWLHIGGAIFISLFMQYYYGGGDSFNYYNGGNLLRTMIVKDPSAVKYLFYSGKDLISTAEELGYADRIQPIMIGDSNAFVMKVSAVISFFAFNQFLIIALFFGFISFIGSWKLFYVLQKINMGRHIQILGYSTICTPSLWIWGSGLLKEPICIFALGMGSFICYNMIIKRKIAFKNLLLLGVLLFVLTVVKGYITAIIIASVFVVFMIRLLVLIRNLVLRIVTIVFFLFIAFVLGMSINADSYIDEIVKLSYSQIESFQNSYEVVNAVDETSKAGFSIRNITPTFSSLVLHSPEVIASCLFRPFIWESRKIIILFAAIESLFICIATLFLLFKTRFFGFFFYAFNDRYRLFSFIFSMLFALVVGYTTFNFGTMVRYKIIFLPFYFFLLISIYTAIESKNKPPVP